jgi:NAD(P)H-hydrate epimerase
MSSANENSKVPSITTDQMRLVDQLMMDEYGISLMQMMENAGRNLAHLARKRFLDGDPQGRYVLILSGSGGNGGGGLVCARRLHNWGATVQVWLSTPVAQLGDVPRQQLAILERMGIEVEVASDDVKLPPSDLIVDALIGYSLRGAPTAGAAALIQAANSHGAPVLALDVPSGVDATTGDVHNPTIRATATLTLALPKHGLYSETAGGYVGELYLADISVPPELYGDPALDINVGPIFARDDILHLK